MSIALYIHVPFCLRKCAYCDFHSLTGALSEKDKYITYVLKELKLYHYNGLLDTVYFGGGTPSLLSIENIVYILNSLSLSENPEITLEVNPSTVDFDKLLGFKKSGVNRLSIGIQSFNDSHLKNLGRLHTSFEAKEVYNLARKAGFENISIDIMFALPNQTMNDLKDDLEEAIFLNPEHISIYSLIWEEGTEFWSLRENGILKDCDEELEASMYEYIIEFLENNGYIHYEISNFAKKSYESKHNSRYWENKEYISLGLGASYYYNNFRGKNVLELDSYYDLIDKRKRPILEEEYVDNIYEYEYILGLRLLKKGIKLLSGNEKYEIICRELVLENYLYRAGDRYFLTRKGLFLANYVFECFID